VTTQKPDRVLIIGLDGATWDVLDPWINDGSLPNLARLRQSGSWGVLRSTIPPISAAAWSTFMTGKRPGKHGVFHFVNLFGEGETGDGKAKIVNARNLKSSTLWDIMGHHSRKVVVINVPMTYPPRPVNGFMITGLLTPRNATIFTYPPELSREITDYVIDLDRFIDTKPFQAQHDPRVIVPTLTLIQEFRDMLEKRARMTSSLMGSKLWDIFMVVFTGTDRMGHYLWPYHRDADMNDRPEIQELCHAVHKYYVRLDEIVGELIERAGEDVTVIVMSDHGMGPRQIKRIHCNYWLYQQGWLSAKTDKSRITNPDSWLRRLGLSRDKIGWVMLRIPGLVGSRLVKKAVKNRSATVNVEQSQAYCVPMWNTVTGIQINLEGETKKALYQEIERELKKIVDPETGQPVVQQVYRGEDCYHGPYADNIPDLIVSMKQDYGCSYHLGHYSSVVTKRQVASREGNHRLEGILIASGRNVVSNPEPLANLNIEDLAPTVLYLMGLPIPLDMDGRVLTEILDSNVLESRPIMQGEPMGLWPNQDEAVFTDNVVSDEDEEQIRERLKALGYLE
jgi:predicted AlkP superfamily phosphohydrolase/phosphomutase